MTSKIETQYFIASPDGRLVPVKIKDLVAGGYKEPRAHEITALPDGTRIAIWPKGSPRPYPLTTADLAPEAYGTEDVKNVEGEYLPTLLRRALEPEEGFKLKDIIQISLVGINTVLISIVIWAVWQIGKGAGYL